METTEKKLKFTDLSEKARKAILDARRGIQIWDEDMNVQTAKEIVGFFESYGPLNLYGVQILKGAKEYFKQKDEEKPVLSQAAQEALDAALAEGRDHVEITAEVAAEIAKFLNEKQSAAGGVLSRKERFIRDAAVKMRDYYYNVHMGLCDTGRFPEEIPEKPEDILTSDARELLLLSKIYWNPERIKDLDVACEVQEFLRGKGNLDHKEQELLENLYRYFESQ